MRILTEYRSAFARSVAALSIGLAAVHVVPGVSGTLGLGPRAANAALSIRTTDNDRYWGGSDILSYEVTVFNLDFIEGVPGVVVTEYIPVNTTFEVAASSPGWSCTPGTDENSTCTLALGDLAPNEQRTVTFAVRVKPGLDPKWDIYNDARVTASVAVPQAAISPTVETAFDLTDDDCAQYDADEACLNVSSATSTTMPETPPLTGVECCALWVFCLLEPFTCFDACLSSFVELSAPGSRAIPSAAVSGGTPARLDLFLFYSLRDRHFRTLPGGREGIALYYRHTGEIARAIVRDPMLRDLGKQALLAWQPGLTALDEGEPATVSAAQVQALTAFLDALRPQASPALAVAIDRGRARLQVETWADITMTDALARLDRLVCKREATGASVVCRIDDVADVLENDAPAGTFTDKVSASLARARSTVAGADQLPAGSKRRAAFKKAAKLLTKLAGRVRSRKGQKAITDSALRERITEAIGLLRADLKTLSQK